MRALDSQLGLHVTLDKCFSRNADEMFHQCFLILIYLHTYKQLFCWVNWMFLLLQKLIANIIMRSFKIYFDKSVKGLIKICLCEQFLNIIYLFTMTGLVLSKCTGNMQVEQYRHIQGYRRGNNVGTILMITLNLYDWIHMYLYWDSGGGFGESCSC